MAPWNPLTTKGVDIYTQTLDPENKSQLTILLINNNKHAYNIEASDIIATVLFETLAHPAFRILNNTDDTISSTVITSPETSHAFNQNHPALPLIRPVDKVSSTIPMVLTFTPDILRHCIGFQNAETLIPTLKNVYRILLHFLILTENPQLI